MPPVIKKQKPTTRRTPKTQSVIDRIQPLQAMDDVGIKINLYGASASGKTTLWSTFPKPILAVLCSGSKNPGELRSINTPELRKSVKQVVLKAPEEILQLSKHCEENPKEFATLVLDHASGLQDMVLASILGIEELPEQLGWGTASQQQWGEVALQVKTYLRALLNLKQNVVIVAQQREFMPDEETSVAMPYVASALSPSIVGWLNPACDYICQTLKKQKMVEKINKVGKKEIRKMVPGQGVEYCLRVGPHETFTTKFRMPKGNNVLPELITDPSYDKIMKLIKAGNSC